MQHFWATVCKTVRPMLSDRCPVCLVLSVTLVYCGQTVGQIKMTLSTQLGLGPGHIVLHGDPDPPPRKRHSPQFPASFYCGETAGCIKMPLGMEVGLSPGDFVKQGGRAPKKFGPCLLWPNGWMDQDGTSHGGRLQYRRLCVRWGLPRPPQRKRGRGRAPNPIFGPFLL